MIRYSLTCSEGHDFDSWFASSAAFDTLSEAGRVACPSCGSARVSKALMAPGVGAGGGDAALSGAAPHPLELLRREIEAKSEYVGRDFASRARAMHEGAARARPIHGEARPAEARALIEEGVPIAPLPFRPRAKTN